jgi:hypothetical protein
LLAVVELHQNPLQFVDHLLGEHEGLGIARSGIANQWVMSFFALIPIAKAICSGVGS